MHFHAYCAELCPEILELPGEINYSELQVFTPNADQALSLPKLIAWMTGALPELPLLLWMLSRHAVSTRDISWDPQL